MQRMGSVPDLGEHIEVVLAELGFDFSEISLLHAERAI
jgi:hypothetical protein